MDCSFKHKLPPGDAVVTATGKPVANYEPALFKRSVYGSKAIAGCAAHFRSRYFIPIAWPGF